MNKTSHAIVRLANYESVKDILEEKDLFTNSEAKPNGMAMLFTNKSSNPNEISIDLFNMASKQLRETVSSMDRVSEFNPNGEIDSDLKDFLYKLMSANESLVNCASISSGDLTELHYFDRIELKSIFQNLANIL